MHGLQENHRVDHGRRQGITREARVGARSSSSNRVGERGADGWNNWKPLERLELLILYSVLLPSARNKIQMLLRRHRHRRILVLSYRVNADPYPAVPAMISLQGTRWPPGWTW